MNRILVVLLMSVVIVLSGCSNNGMKETNRFIGSYEVYSSNPNGDTCEALFETVYVIEDDIIYYLDYSGCSYRDAFYIKEGSEYILIEDALDDDLITVDEIKVGVLSRDRRPDESIEFNEGDYIYLDFYINNHPIYMKYLGICEMSITVVYFEENGIEYFAQTSGCDLDDSILYTYVNDKCVKLLEEYNKGNVTKEELKPLLYQREVVE